MAGFLKNRKKSQGQSPGALIFIGHRKVDRVDLRVIGYDAVELTDQELLDIKEGAHFSQTRTVTWLNVNGLHNTAVYRRGPPWSRKAIRSWISGPGGSPR